jgi:hypothetical protein
MAKQGRSAHAALDGLRQGMADERMKARDAGAALEAARVTVDEADRAVTAAYALEDHKLASQRRKELQAAEADAVELQRRVDAAGLRVQHAQQHVETFARERARDLLAEREQPARTVALELSRAVGDVLKLHRAYVTERQTVDRLVAAVPGATPRADGPVPEHPWESALKDLERAYRQATKLEPPTPRWSGLQLREQQDSLSRFERLRRRKRLTEDERAEMDRLRRNVTVPTTEEN